MNADVKARDLLPQAEIRAQAAENCTRLAGALLRMRRVLDDTNPAGTNFHRAAERINDEYAALMVCMKQISCVDNMKVVDRMFKRHAQWVNTLIKRRLENDEVRESNRRYDLMQTGDGFDAEK